MKSRLLEYMNRLTGRNEKGDLLVNRKMVYAGELYEVASALEEYEDMEEQGKLFISTAEDENAGNDELRKSFIETFADCVIFLNKNAKTDAERELILLIAETVNENIELVPNEQEAKEALEGMKE